MELCCRVVVGLLMSEVGLTLSLSPLKCQREADSLHQTADVRDQVVAEVELQQRRVVTECIG